MLFARIGGVFFYYLAVVMRSVNQMVRILLDETTRLGLSVGFNIQSGWNLGGARVSSKYTAKQLT